MENSFFNLVRCYTNLSIFYLSGVDLIKYEYNIIFFYIIFIIIIIFEIKNISLLILNQWWFYIFLELLTDVYPKFDIFNVKD